MTASTPLEVHTEKSACGYTVQEPSEHGDADSQLSPSVDTDTPATRYTMAEMEAYMQLVRNDRCAYLRRASCAVPSALLHSVLEFCALQGHLLLYVNCD